MKKKIVVFIFFSLAVINTIVAGIWISGIGRKIELLAGRYESAVKMDRSLYDNSSLRLVVSKLEEEISVEKTLKRKEADTLKMTEDVLALLERNRIKVISYRLEGEELAVTAEGGISSVLKLIYELSFSKEGFRINFVSADAGFPGKPAALVIRITYA